MVLFGLATLWAAATINSWFCSLNLVSVAKGRDLVLVCRLVYLTLSFLTTLPGKIT